MRRAAIVAATLAAAAAAPAPRFAPVAGQHYRYTIENRPAAGAGAYVFTGEHDLVFARDGAGWAATLTLRRVTAIAPAAMARMFEAGQHALVDRAIVFHLDAAGLIVGIDDEAALLRDMAGAIAGAGPDADRRAATGRLAAPLTGLDPAARRAFLSSMLAPALAASDADRPGEIGRPVTVPGAGPGLPAATLAGTQDVIREATGAVVIRTRAHDAGEAPATLRIERRIDPAHGLLIREERVVERRGPDGADAPAARDVTVTSLAPVS